ncbi:hypothetical protein Taro_047753 [Colocasia esculenta]|uniref:Peptidase A1 domain-containing protein n=1 Tax=Colocasia esculenta TaxID=4460 RepID=A0A843X4A4_COLES|nr:hypothetical protein [Colocasia esculenta]
MRMTRLGFLLAGLALLVWRSEGLTLSSRLIHRLSDEAREIWVGRGGAGPDGWPSRGSEGYYRALVGSDLRRQKRMLGGARYQAVFPSEGSEAVGLGNDFGWLHYTWVDVGTPNVSFLVALDAGSDYFWVPCDCIQCATLSGRENGLISKCLCRLETLKSDFPTRALIFQRLIGRCSLVFGASIMQGKDLSMYSPAASSTSKHLSCNHELCASEPSCKSPKQPCPYHVGYYTENTSSSGLLVEDVLYLASNDAHSLIQASVAIGCGNRQTGGYLDGIAPDGVLGLGPGDISVPTILAREGLIRNSFSLCFEEDDSGRILFGDQGVSNQQSTPFIAAEGKYVTYVIEVEGWCIGAQCLKQTKTKALVDSGSSFTYLPVNVYKTVVAEFDSQINDSRVHNEDSPWEYCYKASSFEMPVIPKVTLMLAEKKSFVVNNPVFLFYDEGKPDAFCLALQQSEDSFVTIGQNIMTGYRMVFDRENMKLGWSHSHCHDVDGSRTVPLTPPSHERPENPLPTIEEKSPPSGRAVTPAVAGRAPTNQSGAAPKLVFRFRFLALLLFLLAFSVIFAG